MNHHWKLLAPVLGLVLLTACEQQPAEPAATQVAEPPPAAAPVPGGEQLASIAADGNVAEGAPDAGATSELFTAHCMACHGADARGVEGLGLNLVDSQLVATSDSAQLAEFLKAGRSLDSPDNVSGVPMPAFAWMSDAQLAEITGYLKSLQN